MDELELASKYGKGNNTSKIHGDTQFEVNASAHMIQAICTKYSLVMNAVFWSMKQKGKQQQIINLNLNPIEAQKHTFFVSYL